MRHAALPRALPATRCLAICLALLSGVGEGVAVNLQGQHQLNAGLNRPSAAVPLLQQSTHSSGVGSAKPSQNIDTIEHQKAKGSGYAKGSPLYARQKELASASAVASVAKAAAHDPGAPSLVATSFVLLIASACISTAALLSSQSQPHKDASPHGAYSPASEASLQVSMRTPYARPPSPALDARLPGMPPTGIMPPTGMPASIPTGTIPHQPQPQASALQSQPMDSSRQFSGQLGAQPGSSRDMQPPAMQPPAPISSLTITNSRSASPGRPVSPTESNSPSQIGFISQAHVGSPTHSQASQPVAVFSPTSSHLGAQMLHAQSMPTGALGHPSVLDASSQAVPQSYGSWQSLPPGTMPTQPMPTNPQASLPISPRLPFGSGS